MAPLLGHPVRETGHFYFAGKGDISTLLRHRNESLLTTGVASSSGLRG